MNFEQMIEYLDCAWDRDGILGQIREGKFSPEDGDKFLLTLKGMRVNDDALLPKRLVSLVWYLPSFLDWQSKRVEEKGGNLESYKHFVTLVLNALEDILGVP